MHSLTDRALKERIIGAVVLVLLVVLVVPVFLDGPSEETAVVSESVTLPGQNDQKRTQQTIVLDRNRSQPVPATRSGETFQRTSGHEVVIEESSPSPPDSKLTIAETSVPEPAPAQQSAIPQSSTGMWAVQLGSFSNKENAEQLAADLRDQGFAAFLSEVYNSGTALQRVRIGPQKDRSSAESIASQLARAGHEGRVVPHP